MSGFDILVDLSFAGREWVMYKQLGMIIVFAGGLMLSNTAILNEAYAYTSSASGTKTMFGHFTLVVKDEFGNIKDYIEFDNTITDEGDGCIGNLVFGATGATCTGGVMDAVAVSDCDAAGTTDPGNTDCAVIADTTTTFDDLDDADIGDSCKDAGSVTKTYTASTGNNSVRMSAQFATADVDASGEVKEAGILNGCIAGDEVFAMKAFGTVTLTGSDTLTVNYDITFAG